MGKVKGEDVILSIDVAHVLKPIGCARSVQFDISREMIETSVSGSGVFRTYTPGALSYSGSIEGLVFIQKDIDTYYDLGHMYDDIISGTEVYLTFYETDSEGHFLKKECTVYIESISEVASFDNIATFTANFIGTGFFTLTYGDV